MHYIYGDSVPSMAEQMAECDDPFVDAMLDSPLFNKSTMPAGKNAERKKHMANEKKKWTKTRKKGGAYGGVVVREEGTGREHTLLSPSQKGAKYSQELREGQRYYNNGVRREGEDGAPVELSRAQRSYRAGYLDAQKDVHKIFRKQNPDYQRKTK